METGNHRVEVFIDGSLVYTTREPGQSFAAKPICEATEASRHFRSIQAMPQEVFAVMSLGVVDKFRTSILQPEPSCLELEPGR